MPAWFHVRTYISHGVVDEWNGLNVAEVMFESVITFQPHLINTQLWEILLVTDMGSGRRGSDRFHTKLIYVIIA